MSNCLNSGIDTVGVLTQYEPHVLNEHIGNGSPWDLDRMNGGVTVLQPHTKKNDEGGWYKGTANAIYQNISFVDKYNPEHVLILSGDHIYKMDYDKMLEAHKATCADCTIACMKVPMKEASRFGILNTNPDGSIYEFEEKPKQPKSDLASMGIYIFTASKLFKYLELDEKDPKSEKDFGKNILPNMLNAGEKMYSYRFEGYWKDVGTITSLWEANMDLLGKVPNFDLRDAERVIHSRSPLAPPAYVEGTVVNSLIANGCDVEGTVINSVLGTNCEVGKGAKVVDSVIQPGAKIGEGAKVTRCIVADDVEIAPGATVGSADSEHIELVAKKYVE